MTDLRKRSMLTMIAFFFALLLSLTAVASADDDGGCPNARVAGQWGYTEAGTIFLPTGPVPFAAVGKITFDAAGNAAGVQTSSTAGKVSQDTIKGTYSVDADCTGATTVGVYDAAGNLLRTVSLALVFDDNTKETRGVVTSLALPNGLNLPTVITLEGRKQVPHHEGD